MKKILLVFTLIFSFAFCTTSFAENKSQEYTLNPDLGNQKTFKKVSLTVDGDTYKVNVKGNKDSNGVEGYNITVDTKTLKYKATKLKKKDLIKFESEVNANLINSKASTLAASTHYIQVKAVTDDPIGADLAWTTHKLTWDYDGTYANKNTRDGTCTAANPSSLGTHWYTDRCAYTNYNIIDGGRTVTSTLEADYHNYDFQSNSKRTDVTHDVYLEGHGSGSSWYDVTWTKSGEGSSLLDLDIYVTKN